MKSTLKLSGPIPFSRSNKVELLHIIEKCFAGAVLMIQSHNCCFFKYVMSLFPQPFLIAFKSFFPLLIKILTERLSHSLYIFILIPNCTCYPFFLNNAHQLISLLIMEHLGFLLLENAHVFLRIYTHYFQKICYR